MKISVDLHLFFTALFIIITSLLLHQSFSNQSLHLQLVHLGVGILFFLALSKIDLSEMVHFRWHLYIVSIVLLTLTLFFGRQTHGAIRWLAIGDVFVFQPSEIIKVLLIFSFSAALSQTDLSRFNNLLKLGLLYLLPIILILLQPNFSTGLIILFIFLAMLFASGARLIYHLFFIISAIVASPLIWHFLKDYQKNRILTFLNPLSDPLGKGYNSIQAIIAVGSGQIFGRGFGHGTQSKLRFLPENQTDFIFASLAEEIGFVGSILLIIVFAWLILRIFSLASRAQDKFKSTTIVGIGAMFATQTVINIGMNIGLLPVTGITLPLMSAGGSSLVASLAALSIVNNFATSKSRSQAIEIT